MEDIWTLPEDIHVDATLNRALNELIIEVHSPLNEEVIKQYTFYCGPYSCRITISQS